MENVLYNSKVKKKATNVSINSDLLNTGKGVENQSFKNT